MDLMPPEVADALPPLYANEDKGLDVPVIVKYFNPSGAGTWHITEYDPETGIMFGLCDLGMGFPELGNVSLDELKSVRGPLGLGIERDLHMPPTTLREALDKAKA